MRNVVLVTTLLIAGLLVASEQPGVDPNTALSRLKQGNARSAAGKQTNPSQGVARRTSIAKEQHPFAVVVSCSDSRVPPELVFDQGLGDLFVVRVAGDVVDAHALGSIEYALEHLGPKLVVVLGHERCGAVKAAVDGGEAPPNIASLVKAIQPAVNDVANVKGDKVDAAVRANVKRVAQKIRSESASGKGLKVVGMYYDLDTAVTEVVP